MRIVIDDLALECVQGDITKQHDCDAIVNAANARLEPGGGVAGAIHRAAGPELAEACRPFAPIEVGQAVLTAAFALPNRYVIHVLGPVYACEEDPASQLAACYRNALREAEVAQVESIAFPAVSTGIFGYPIADATDVALATTDEALPHLRSIRLIRFVLFAAEDLAIYEERMAARFGASAG